MKKKKGEIRKGGQLSLFSMKYMMTSSQSIASIRMETLRKNPKAFLHSILSILSKVIILPQ